MKKSVKKEVLFILELEVKIKKWKLDLHEFE